MTVQNVDALIVGAGYGGIYALKKLLDQGLHVKVIDTADGVGGTWFWNRYPGAMSEYVFSRQRATRRLMSSLALNHTSIATRGTRRTFNPTHGADTTSKPLKSWPI